MLALLMAAQLAAVEPKDDCDSSASARATCNASLAKIAMERRVARSFRAALAAARRADHDPDRTRADYSNNESFVTSLQKSQRGWATFADKTCDFEELEERYGTQHGVLFQRCYEKLAKDRISWLIGVTKTYR